MTPATDTQLECARKIADLFPFVGMLVARIDEKQRDLTAMTDLVIELEDKLAALEMASQPTQDGAVAWRYKRLGRPNWNVTNNADLIDGLPAKGSHTIEPLFTIATLRKLRAVT